MTCTLSNTAQRTYVVRTFVGALLCLVVTTGASVGFRFGHLSGPLAYLVAALPAFPIMGMLVVTGLYLSEEKDDFQRELMVQSLLAGIGLTLASTTVWGYLEDFAHAPHLSMVWIFPMFWVFTGLATPFVWMRYR
ncbi:hypothetical protein [Occallatibacter riparius]|uniref:Transmembrane protein n=1 Tax=Occallatibacter riparius TaxID=1002689 RepID=A0A9J7BGW8_9BACT|nr:hypothetical protein [Occallatibacter riparius]UWZ82220.1 hypothetical protein MOP44_16745 [Occallatibacter riparius]